MKIISYGVRPVEESFFHQLSKFSYTLDLVPELLTDDNTHLCQGADVVMLRGNCKAHRENLIKIKELGFELCARVPSYSPTAISELAVAMALGLSRKTVRNDDEYFS